MELVLDASVVIKWFLDEKLSDEAINYRRKHLEGKIALVAPSLLAFEVINALCTKSGVSIKTILSAIKVYYFAKIKEYSLNEKLAQRAAASSKKFKISVYDASYLALAQSLNCSFITADEKFYQKIKSLKLVKLLGKEQTPAHCNF